MKYAELREVREVKVDVSEIADVTRLRLFISSRVRTRDSRVQAQLFCFCYGYLHVFEFVSCAGQVDFLGP